MLSNLRSTVPAEGLPYAEPEALYNTRLAQELGKWADEIGVPQLHDGLFRAYFVEGINIGKVEDLVQIAERVGLNADDAQRVLEERLFKKAVDEDWARSTQLGVTAVPTFVVGGWAVVGAQPYGTLRRFMEHAGVSRRTDD